MAFAAMLMVPITFGSTSAVSADITIIGDDDQDAFVGTGSLLLPPQIATDFREVAAACPGCVKRKVQRPLKQPLRCSPSPFSVAFTSACS